MADTPRPSEADEDKSLQRLADIKKTKEQEAHRVERYVTNVKNSLLFRPGFNWGDILSAAPTSICVIGGIFVLSTTADAAVITVHPPDGGFKSLKSSVQCISPLSFAIY